MSKQQSMLDVNPSARRDEDFYATLPWQSRALIRRLGHRISSVSGAVMEPCVGDGAIVKELLAAYPNLDLLTNDIVVREPMVPDFLLDARARGSWQTFRNAGRISVALTNPPFNEAFEIAEQAYEHVDEALILLLRWSWAEPTEDRGPWLKAHPPTSVIVMPRPDYRGTGKSDSVTSSWFIWVKPGSDFCEPFWDTVLKSDRDALMRAA